MKPTPYRNASAIYFFNKESALLMDCAEGSYGQIFDHFGTKEKVDSVLLFTRVIYITHLHGDHQLGLLKIMQERDKLLCTLPENMKSKLYVAIPTPMLEWI